MKVSELKEKSVEELNNSLLELREEQFKLRMSQSNGQDTKGHLFRNVRRDIARVKTVINEKQGKQA